VTKRDPNSSAARGYGLEPLATPPALPGSIIVRKSADSLIDAILADMFMHAQNCVRTFGDFHAALSGEPALDAAYVRLMYDPNYRLLPWKRTHLWLTADRRVGFDDERSAFRLLRETIIDHSDIPREQTHPIFPLADDAAQRYERELREALAWREKGHDRLDYALLALGPNGELAGLHPRDPALRAGNELMTVASGPRAPAPTPITMTLPLLNASRFIAVVAVGEQVRPTLARIAEGDATAHDMPAAGIRPLAGELRWYLDEAACA